MSERFPISEDPQSVDGNDEFDQAVAECILRLESGREIDSDWLKTNYPNWYRELADFIADWDALEGFSNELRCVGAHSFANANDIPDVIGGYQVVELIGSGGMGVIYKARQPSLSRFVAIKMLHNVRHDRRRFQTEAESAARLDHPNIVSIFEVGDHDGHPFYTMPYIDGDDLDAIVRRERLLPNRAAKIAATIASAAHYAHQRGILHRDLKPGNILIDADDQPHITDFGLAKRIESTEQLTRTNAIIGTPSYMAPEQAMGNNADVSVATDIYGVGAILYAMLTGKAPFSGNNSMEVLRQVVDTNPRGLDSSIVTPDLKIICEKCLDKRPANRYASAGDLEDDLRRYLAGKPITARPLGKLNSAIRWVQRNPMIATQSATASVLLLFGLVSLSLLLRSENDARREAEAGTARERELNAEIQRALDRENAARRRAELTLGDAYANYGYAAQQQGRPNEAFLWFCNAGRISPNERLAFNNRRISAWMARIPRPLFAHHERSLTVAKFDPSSRWLLCSRENQTAFRVFDLHSGEPIAIEFDGLSTCVRWGSKPSVLWFGTTEGAVFRFDCNTIQLEEVANLSTPIASIDESSSCSSVAIGFDKQVAIYNQLSSSIHNHTGQLPAKVIDIQFCCQDRSVAITCRNNRVYRKSIQLWIQDSEGDATASDDELAIRFDLRDRSGLKAEKNQVFYPTVYGDDKLALLRHSSSGKSERLYVYDLNTGQRIYACALGISYANSVPNVLGEVVNGGDRYARIRTLDNEPHSERILHGRFVTRCDSSPDGQLVATADWQNVCLTERTDVGELFRESNDIKTPFAIIPHPVRVSQLSFSDDNRMLATVQFDGLIRVWDISNALQPKTEFEVEEQGNRAAFAPGPKGIFTGMHHRSGEVQSFREIDLDSYEVRRIESDITGQLRDAVYTSDGRQFALAVAEGANKSGYVLIAKCATAEAADTESKTIRIDLSGDPRSIACHPNKHQYAVLCGDGTTVVINGDSGEVEGECVFPKKAISVPSYPAHNGIVMYSPNGESLVQFGNRASSGMQVFSTVDFSQRFSTFENDGILIQQCDVSPDGHVIAIAGGRSNKISFLDIKTGEQVAEPIEHPSVVYSSEFSPDGQRLVSGCRDGQARIFDWKSGKVLTPALEHDRDVVAASFADHGNVVVTIANDKLAKIWDTQTGLQICPPIFVGDGMRYLAVDSATQRALVSGRVSKATLIDLSQSTVPETVPNDDVYILAELVAHASFVNAGTVRLTSDEWIERWHRYRQTELYRLHSSSLLSGLETSSEDSH